MTEDLRRRLSALETRLAEDFGNSRIDEVRGTAVAGYSLGFQKLSGIVVELAEALEKNAVPLGVPLSLINGDIKGACKELNQERYEMRKRAAEALRSLETFLAKEEGKS